MTGWTRLNHGNGRIFIACACAFYTPLAKKGRLPGVSTERGAGRQAGEAVERHAIERKMNCS
jgi:hypothetical protein